MKAAQFDYQRPSSVEEAVRLLSGAAGAAKVLAGGQSLGPMMRMRLARPTLLVDVRRIPELTEVREEPDAILIGAAVPHAAIEDGEVPDVTCGMMRNVARGIAYRAVRNMGTIGGSLAHADPAADWITCLSAIGAETLLAGPHGRRTIAIDVLMVSAFETMLAPSELIVAVRVPRLSTRARWGYRKLCRKSGELAAAMAAVVDDEARGLRRAALGATESAPIVLADAGDLLRSPEAAGDIVCGMVGSTRCDAMRPHLAMLRRALEQASHT